MLPALREMGINRLIMHAHSGACEYATDDYPFWVIGGLTGGGEFRIDGTWRKVTTPAVYLCPPGQAVHKRGLRGHIWRETFIEYLPECRDPVIRGIRSQELREADIDAFQLAAEGLRHEHTASGDRELMVQWAALAHAQATRLVAARRPRRRLGNVWKAVEADISRPWTLGDLAEVAELSAQHLRVVCNRETGTSPMRYLTRLRLQRAAAILRTETATLEQVTQVVGFAKQPTLSRAFKQQYGVTPGAYRRAAP